jgi:hypothetical protein
MSFYVFNKIMMIMMIRLLENADGCYLSEIKTINQFSLQTNTNFISATKALTGARAKMGSGSRCRSILLADKDSSALCGSCCCCCCCCNCVLHTGCNNNRIKPELNNFPTKEK